MSSERNWDAWPPCDTCGRARQTICPTCGNAGNRFPLAEYQALAEPQRGTRESGEEHATEPRNTQVLLLCERCDEAFRPRFYRMCPACGAEAADGLAPAGKVNEQLSSRVLLAIYGLLAVAALLLLYFWWLFRAQ